MASRAIGLPVLAAGTSPYIDVMFGPHYQRRLFIISTPTSGEAARVDIGDASNHVNIMTTGETLPGMAHFPTDGPRQPRPGDTGADTSTSPTMHIVEDHPTLPHDAEIHPSGWPLIDTDSFLGGMLVFMGFLVCGKD